MLPYSIDFRFGAVSLHKGAPVCPLLVAITEDETQWNINPEDTLLYRSKRHDRFFQPHPEIDWTRLEKMMI